MESPVESLIFALEKYPERVATFPARKLLLESARKSSKRPAYIKLAVPDDMAKSVRGAEDKGDLVLLVRVPRDVIEREGSRLVLPGEVG